MKIIETITASAPPFCPVMECGECELSPCPFELNIDNNELDRRTSASNNKRVIGEGINDLNMIHETVLENNYISLMYKIANDLERTHH